MYAGRKWMALSLSLGLSCSTAAIAQELMPPAPPAYVEPSARQSLSETSLESILQRLETLERERAAMLDPNNPQFHNASHALDVLDAPEKKDAKKDAKPSADDRLKALEKDVAKLKPDPKKPSIKASGRVHFDAWTFPGSDELINVIERGNINETPEDRLQFRRVRFGFNGDIADNMFYKIEMEFAGGNAVEYRDVFLGWNNLPVFQTVILGNHKRPYGYDHLNSSRYNIFMERPFMVEAMNQDARRIGLSANGVSEDEQFNWRYGYWAGEIAQNNAGPIGDAWQGEVAGRFAHTWWYDESSGGRGYGHWAVSGAWADPAINNGNNGGAHTSTSRLRTRPSARSTNRWLDTNTIVGAEDYTLGGVEGVFNAGAFHVASEWQMVSMDRVAGVGPGGGASCFFHGGYIEAAYMLTGEHMPWERKTGTLDRLKPFQNFFVVNTCKDTTASGWGAWQAAIRYDYADLSDSGINGGVGEAVTVGANWYWNANARLQFNYIHGMIRQSRFATAATGPSGDYDIIGARWMIDF